MEPLEIVHHAQKILIPKGKNRKSVINWLNTNGVYVPEFVGECLHR